MTEDRDQLIARKNDVRRQIDRIRRQLAQEQVQPRPSARRIRQLQEQLERLMAEEHELRLAIDRSGQQ
jgi:chromosome segregation ATPase